MNVAIFNCKYSQRILIYVVIDFSLYANTSEYSKGMVSKYITLRSEKMRFSHVNTSAVYKDQYAATVLTIQV